MSPRHATRVKTQRFGSGPWWVELARLGAAALCAAVYGLAALAVSLVLFR